MLPFGLAETWDGVMGRVAERVGAVRIWRRGRESCCSLPSSVTMRVRFGALGRRGGGGRRKGSRDGGGESFESFR